jgi:ATP-dependent Clp protease ATP-binding subunit ClpC
MKKKTRKWVAFGDRDPPDEVSALKKFLEERLFGQPKAINAVCKIYEYHLTLRQLEKRKTPIGVFLFLGPSGTGKTELARLIAEYFCGSAEAMTRVDGADFSQPHTIHKLIGAPHGYIGFDQKAFFSKARILERLNIKVRPGKKEFLQRKFIYSACWH